MAHNSYNLAAGWRRFLPLGSNLRRPVFALLFTTLTLSADIAAQPSLALTSASGAPGGSISMSLAVHPATTQLSALQWTISYPAGSIAALSVTEGAAVLATGKTVSCSGNASAYTCAISGMNATPISDGVVAVLSIRLPVPAASTSIGITGALGASPTAALIPLTASGASIQVVNSAQPGVTALTCSPTSLSGSSSTTCSVKLSGPAPASLTVPVVSGSSALIVPAVVTIPQGAQTATFAATARAVSSNQTTTVTAALNGTSASATIALAASGTPALSGLSCPKAMLGPSSSMTCTVTLAKPAPTGGLTVTISGMPAVTDLRYPASVNVAAGSDHTFLGVSTWAVSKNQTIALTVSLNGSSTQTAIQLSTTAVLAGSGTPALSALSCPKAMLGPSSSMTCTVTLAKPAPTGGLTVTISGMPAATDLRYAASVNVAAGSDHTFLGVSTWAVSKNQTVTLTVSLNGSSAQTAIQLTPAAVFVTSLTCPISTLGPLSSETCTATLSKAAPAGGVTVAVNAAPAVAGLSVPASLTIGAGADHGFIGVSTRAISSLQTITLMASLNGISTTRAITLAPPPKATTAAIKSAAEAAAAPGNLLRNASLSCSAKQIDGGKRALCELLLDSPGADNSSVVLLSSSSEHLKIPTRLVLRPGQRRARFEVASDNASPADVAQISAQFGDTAVQTDITVAESLIPYVIAPRSITGTPGSAVRFVVAVRDGSSSPLGVTPSRLPEGAIFDAQTGVFEWTPSIQDLGGHEVTFAYSSGAAAPATATTRIDVASGRPTLVRARNFAAASASPACIAGGPATLIGKFLSGVTGPVEAPDGGSTELGGARVLVGDSYVPLLRVSATRIDFVCPDAPAGSSFDVSIETAGGRSNSLKLPVNAAAPGIFTVGPRQALAIRQGASDVAAIPNPELGGEPAAAGDLLIIRATGLACDASSPLPRVKLADQYAVTISMARLDGPPAACRLTVEVPPGTASGTVPLQLEVTTPGGTVTSNIAFVGIEN